MRGEAPGGFGGRDKRERYARYAKRRTGSLPSVTRPGLLTIGRVVLPAVVAAALGVSYYDNISSFINENWLDSSSIRFLSSDEIQFIPSFLTVLSLLFSILAGNAYTALYAQQETIYFALYAEVSEAKSLLEQMALVCSGRPFYKDVLRMMKVYIKTDLRRLDVPPADLMARSPSQDPLESIMYLTSVGVPSVIYETVRDLRQARGYRLGAMQRKFPRLGIVLLYILALLELAAFPLLGAGTAVGAPQSIFNVQGALFGGLCGATTLVLRIIQELWRTSGGAFNVDVVLTQMVRGLVEELDARATGELSFERNADGTAANSLSVTDDVAMLSNLRQQVSDLEAKLDTADAAALADADAAGHADDDHRQPGRLARLRARAARKLEGRA